MSSGREPCPVPNRRRDLLFLCRPRQWAKNVFVLAPLLFSQSLLDPALVANAFVAFACFCLFSSAVYILNDLLDVEADRRHPRKCMRPLPAGEVSPGVAVATATLLTAGAAAAASLLLPATFLFFAGLYLGNSLCYCLWLKHRVIVDVIVIGIGFVLRLLGGCAAIAVAPSSWIIVCGFSLALVLGFGKRRGEVAQLGSQAEYRATLLSYNAPKLDTLLAVSTAVTLLSSMLYTLAPDTVQRHGTANLVYTVPFVAYGLFRYLFKVQEGKGDGPSEVLTGDLAFPLTGLLWTAAVLLILYFR